MFTLSRFSDLADLPFDEIIDVRSPSEFIQDHIPGAVSLPVLDDAERARVGTIYVQQSRFMARRVGAGLVARNTARHLETYLAGKPSDYRPLVYCWRGGQRSGSFATILRAIGWQPETLDGGYKRFRHCVLDALYHCELEHSFILLDGNTGSAKTQLLDRLDALGVQTLDLEGLARHRGSLFGGFEKAQPSQKAFESSLAHSLMQLDASQAVVVEAESSRIGRLTLPPALLTAMKQAKRIFLDVPLPARAAHVIASYPDMTRDPSRVAAIIERLRVYQPRERILDWQAMVERQDWSALTQSIMEHHYDPKYAQQRAKSDRDGDVVVQASRLDSASLETVAHDIVRVVSSLA